MACSAMPAEIAPTRQFFRTLNRIVEPAVRRGFGTSVHGPGIFVVETTGRRSGRRRRGLSPVRRCGPPAAYAGALLQEIILQ
jgi:hypothetical protein